MTQAFVCSKCHEEKAGTEFYWSRGRRSGFCKPCQQEYVKSRPRSARAGDGSRESNRRNWRRYMYGLEPWEYAQLLYKQGGVCALCQQPPKKTPGRDNPVLYVDHDHKTGEVRGLLCHSCNQALDKRPVDWYIRAATYLQRATSEDAAPTDPLERNGVELRQDTIYIESGSTAPAMTAEGDSDAAVFQAASERLPVVPEFDMSFNSQFREERNWRAECAEADRMDGQGERHQRTSAYQERRRAQIVVLQAAWLEMFGEEHKLSPASAKDLLNLTDDWAEDVLDVMEEAQQRRVAYPRGYVVKTLQNKRVERQRMEAASPARSARPQVAGNPVTGMRQNEEDDIAQDGYYREPPPDVKAKMEKFKRLVAKGLIKVEEDDDE